MPTLFNTINKREAPLFDLKAGKLERTIPIEFSMQVTDLSPGDKWLVGLQAKAKIASISSTSCRRLVKS